MTPPLCNLFFMIYSFLLFVITLIYDLDNFFFFHTQNNQENFSFSLPFVFDNLIQAGVVDKVAEADFKGLRVAGAFRGGEGEEGNHHGQGEENRSQFFHCGVHPFVYRLIPGEFLLREKKKLSALGS